MINDNKKPLDSALSLLQNGETEKGVDLIRKCADKGDADALYILGCLYRQGDGLPRNYKRAIQSLERSFDRGNNAAAFILGTMYYSGQGCDKSPEKAADIWSKAAAKGELRCAYNLSMLYERGIGVKQDIHRALGLLRACAKSGFDPAVKRLEEMKVSTDEPVDIESLKNEAEAGDAKALYKLASAYLRGRGVEKDKAEATRLFALSAKGGNFLAKIALFNRYYIDAEYTHCWTCAEFYLKQIIEEDQKRFEIVHPNVVNAIGEINKANSEQDGETKKALAAKAAGLGYYGAYVMLGDLCGSDEKEAYGYYLKGTEYGDATAYLRLYDIYSNENSEFFDFDKGQKMLEKYEEIAALLASLRE